MSRAIGIFNVQEQAIEAVQSLESRGFGQEQLKVIAKDREHAARIESETDVHADELQEIADNGGTGRGTRIGLFGLAGFAGLGGLGGAGNVGTAGSTGNAGMPAAGAAGALALGSLRGDDLLDPDGGNGGLTDALRSLGLSDSEADVCSEAVERGSLVVVADTEANDAEDDAGRGLLDAARETFRSAGAQRII